MIKEYLPRLAHSATYGRSLSLFAFALDLCIPPLSLVVILLVILECVTFCWFVVTAHIGPFSIASASTVLLSASIGIAWWRVGREIIHLRDIFCYRRILWSKNSFFRPFPYQTPSRLDQN